MEIFSTTRLTTPYTTRSHIWPSSLPKGWYLPTAFKSLLPIPNQSWVMAPTIRAIGFFQFFENVSELNRQFQAQFSPKPNSDHQAFQRTRIHPGENFHPSCPSSTNLDLFLLKHGNTWRPNHCLLPTYLPTSSISVRDSLTFMPPNSLRWSFHMYTQGL